MGRIRTVKPEMAKHELLFEIEQELGVNARFAWAMLPTQCDRKGCFKWRPRALKLDLLPYDDCDFSRVLDAWVTRGMLVRYRVGDAWYGSIPTWRRHQTVNHREADSDIPPIEEADEVIDYINQRDTDASGTRDPRADDSSPARPGDDMGTPRGKGREGKGKEGKGREGASPTRDSSPPLDGEPVHTETQAMNFEPSKQTVDYLKMQGIPWDQSVVDKYRIHLAEKISQGKQVSPQTGFINWCTRERAYNRSSGRPPPPDDSPPQDTGPPRWESLGYASQDEYQAHVEALRQWRNDTEVLGLDPSKPKDPRQSRTENGNDAD